MYFYNASEADLTLVHSWGNTTVLKAGQWTRVEPACSQPHLDGWSGGIGGTQIGLDADGEYLMQISANMSNVTGGTNYTIYMAGCYI